LIVDIIIVESVAGVIVLSFNKKGKRKEIKGKRKTWQRSQ
jgi:hypothetical protein